MALVSFTDVRTGACARRLLYLCVLLTLVGCQKSSVVQEVSQKQANQVVAALGRHGIDADVVRESGNSKGRYRVEVRPSYYSQAVALLESKGLPKVEPPDFQELIEPKGLLPSSRSAEQLRLDYALAIELERLIQALPGIIDAKAVVRQFSADSPLERSASILVVLEALQPSHAATTELEKIKKLAKRALVSVPLENISITIENETHNGADQEEGLVVGAIGSDRGGKVQYVPLREFVGIFRVPQSEYLGISLTLTALMLLTGCAGAIFGYWYGVYNTGQRGRTVETKSLLPKVIKPAQDKRAMFDLTANSGDS